ncbi:MAG: RnfABCDGE type electron transport complex subunit D [Spirochaetaceae bacterium]|nr:MAG: RnfABCDGE type electron transport complex subunit D [Spirochaetaceae bacterium]
MSAPTEGFILTSSPHDSAADTTQRIMFAVVLTLLPAVVMSVFYFGLRVLGLYLLAIVTCLLTESLTRRARGRSPWSIADGSAVVTAVLLVMVLPPRISPIALMVGCVVAVFLGKEVFGGIGCNVFNPALVGRAFLSAAYPVQITTWTVPNRVFGFLPQGIDARTQATPLAAARFEGIYEALPNLVFGQIGGSIGETGSVFIVVGGLAMLALKLIRWEMVVSLLGTVFVLTGVFYLADPINYVSPVFHLFAGGLMLGAFYMATDMVTTPYTRIGNVIFGLGAGILVVVIRLFGGYPEGVMFAILLMNAVTPIINRYSDYRVFGAERAGGRSRSADGATERKGTQ